MVGLRTSHGKCDGVKVAYSGAYRELIGSLSGARENDWITTIAIEGRHCVYLSSSPFHLAKIQKVSFIHPNFESFT